MCTSFRLTAADGAVIVGRTMEFPNAMATKLTVLPRAYRGTGIGKHGSGMKWTSEYGVVGMDAFGQPGTLTDALNEQGLYAGLLYMPGFCEYTPAEDTDPASLMSIVDTVAYVLGVSATVQEATAAMGRATVWPYVFGPFGFAPPAHLVLHDASGKSAVVEWRDGELTGFANPIGVGCNRPHGPGAGHERAARRLQFPVPIRPRRGFRGQPPPRSHRGGDGGNGLAYP